MSENSQEKEPQTPVVKTTASIGVLGAIIIVALDYFNLSMDGKILFAVPLASATIVAVYEWCWASVGPASAKSIKEKRNLKSQMKEIKEYMSAGDISPEARVKMQKLLDDNMLKLVRINAH